MIETLVGAGALLVALGATIWSGLLALADQSPQLSRTLGEPATGAGSAIPLARAFHITRLALLVVGGAAAGTVMTWWLRPLVPAVGSLMITGLLVFMLGDALPRAFGALVPEGAAAMLPAARRSVSPVRPFLAVAVSVDRFIQRLLPARPVAQTGIGSAQRDMLLGVFSLADTTVADVMTPRLDIVAIQTRASWPEVVDTVRRGEHARLPVYRSGLDDIAGILHAKDLVPAVAGAAPIPDPWQELVRPAQFVPESKPLAAQLRDFQRGPGHLAIVVDEFGGTSGLITLEDVLEEVVGEIRDEYDQGEEPAIAREGDEKFWVDGRVTLDDLSQQLGTAIEHEDVSTVGGLIYSELGRVPEPGEELRINGFRVVVEQVLRRRIRRVYFERLPEAAPVEGLLAHREGE